MECPECRFDSREGAKFCSECGNKLEVGCPECRHAGKVKEFTVKEGTD